MSTENQNKTRWQQT